MRALLTLSILFSIAADAEEYTLSVDSLLQEGVPQGSVEKHTWDTSSIYPGTTTDYWVYVPAQYTKEKPACVMVFQDGQAYLSTEGPLRAPTVFDNLIHKEEMPVTIGIFVSSGMRERPGDQREVRYVTIGDTYARKKSSRRLRKTTTWSTTLWAEPSRARVTGDSYHSLSPGTVQMNSQK
jgi:enterochelin esterase-like enzyme